ncbi:hypothetical protein JL722_11641 [Aureococcus anophagefferens]|nr:hypothetical protein JL722_11641 [Aureococcus anophagefferens]
MAPRWLEVEYDDGDDVVCGWAPAAFFDAEEPPEPAERRRCRPPDDDDDDGVLPRPPGIAPSSGAASSRPTSPDLDAARDHAAEKIAALAKPKRKTKKRW